MNLRDEANALIAGRLAALAARGLSMKEAASEIGTSYVSVRAHAIRYGIVFTKKYSRQEDTALTARKHEMVARFRAGETLQVIGDSYGLTRERVRQIVALEGVSASDGGQSAKAIARKSEKRNRREREAQAKWGCSRVQYLELISIGKKMRGEGNRRERTPTGAFITQKNNARSRGIEWKLTLWEWWSIWQESGRWNDRGRGHAFMMCRRSDRGAYAVGNVFIAPGHFNTSSSRIKKSGLPIGVSEPRKGSGRFVAQIIINGKRIHLGIFPSPDLAHDAYLSALAALTPSEEAAA